MFQYTVRRFVSPNFATATNGSGVTARPAVFSDNSETNFRDVVDGLSNAIIVAERCFEGRASSGSTDENGNYELNFTRDRKGAIIGSHEVRITTSTVEGEGVVAPKEMVPKKYNDNSTLTAEVKSGVNAHVDFQLTSS